MSAAATRHRGGRPGRTPAPSGTRSGSPWSRARTGAGVTSTRTMSEVAIDQPTSIPLAESPDIYGAYPRLSDDQIATLEAGGARRAGFAGEKPVREGGCSAYFFVILSGEVAVTTTDDAGNPDVIQAHRPWTFLGVPGVLRIHARI